MMNQRKKTWTIANYFELFDKTMNKFQNLTNNLKNKNVTIDDMKWFENFGNDTETLQQELYKYMKISHANIKFLLCNLVPAKKLQQVLFFSKRGSIQKRIKIFFYSHATSKQTQHKQKLMQLTFKKLCETADSVVHVIVNIAKYLKTKPICDASWEELNNDLKNAKELKNEQNISDAAQLYEKLIKIIPGLIKSDKIKWFEKINKYEQLLIELTEGTQFQQNWVAKSVM